MQVCHKHCPPEGRGVVWLAALALAVPALALAWAVHAAVAWGAAVWHAAAPVILFTLVPLILGCVARIAVWAFRRGAIPEPQGTAERAAGDRSAARDRTYLP